MIEGMIQEIFSEAFRVLFLSCVPFIIGIAGVGLLSAVLQTATAIHEGAISYALKILALFGIFTILVVPMREAIVALFTHAIKG
jgi:flagellar biosynthesis protein FliQ